MGRSFTPISRRGIWLKHPQVACCLNNWPVSNFFGPFQVLERVEEVAYRLDLPQGSRIHQVFHVSLLKPCIGDAAATQVPMPPFDDEGLLTPEPVAILDTRWISKGSKCVEQLLVQWKGMNAEDATWEDAALVRDSFPLLEDKDVAQRGNDRIIEGARPRRTQKMPARYFD